MKIDFLLCIFLQEARALLGRLEYQRGNFDAALQVFQGIDVRGLTSRMTKAIVERTRPPRKPRLKGDTVPPSVMSIHSVSLLLEAILLKAKSMEELGHYRGTVTSYSFRSHFLEGSLFSVNLYRLGGFP